MRVYLIGVGMGNPATLTLEAKAAIEESKVLIGAPRLLEPYQGRDCRALIAADQVAQAIAGVKEGPVGVLLSGDVGFYSGAKKLRERLDGYEVRAFPGISSLSYFCAQLGTSWQDVHIVSAHGRTHNALGEITSHSRTFLLTGGATLAQDICKSLKDHGLGELVVSVGERLSYPEQRICTGTAAELAEQTFESLAVMLVENPRPVIRTSTAPGIPDSAFQRGKAPMTKEEVRTLVLSKLRPQAHHVVWDVGAGTGSVSIECALACPAGWVYAVEKEEPALELLEENRQRFGVCNLTVVPGRAPEALKALPAPDRVFLGGTAGTMEASLTAALEKNPALGVVATAVTLETLAESVRVFEAKGLQDVDIVQIAVTRTRQVGPYHMMDANNPVWIISGEGRA